MSHAPSASFVAAMMTVIVPLTTAPVPLIAIPLRQPRSRSRRCRTAIPAWENVNDVNTPMA